MPEEYVGMAQRRTHRKSKLGCQSCKRRHIKCDENQPICSNCSTTERNCVYLPARPRTVRSTSIDSSQISAKDACTRSVATSPSLSLLPPVSSAKVSVSTPSSFAASPILTPASPVYYGVSCSNINTRHMELLSNFILETVPSLSISNIMDMGLMRTTMPTILSAPHLLHQTLALSALHLSHIKPEQADSYHADATSLQIEALTSFEQCLGKINISNCESMLMFASFLGIQSLAEAVIAAKNDAESFLDRFVTYLNLHRGVQAITSQAWALLLQSGISPILQEASFQLDLAASHASEQALSVTDKLNHLLDDADMGSESNIACRDAVSRLQLMYQTDCLEDDCSEGQKQSPGLIWTWPILLSGTYTDLLQKRQPEALIILCHYAVLLHYRRNMWPVGSAGRMLIESVTRSLGSYWRHWLDWPNEVIRNSIVP